MIDIKAKALIKKRKSLHPEDSTAIEECWFEEIELFSNNVDDTIDFITNRCTVEEFVWISEVFEEIAEKTNNKKFVDCLARTAKKFPEEAEKYNLTEFINSAKEMLRDE